MAEIVGRTAIALGNTDNKVYCASRLGFVAL
jgi:hypothetical protein